MQYLTQLSHFPIKLALHAQTGAQQRADTPLQYKADALRWTRFLGAERLYHMNGYIIYYYRSSKT